MSTNDHDGGEMLDTLKIKGEDHTRKDGGVWIDGAIAGHLFQALLFPEHAENPAHEMDDSRISKFWLKDAATGKEVASFDRGWDMKPATKAARAIVGLFTAGLAEHVFGK